MFQVSEQKIVVSLTWGFQVITALLAIVCALLSVYNFSWVHMFTIAILLWASFRSYQLRELWFKQAAERAKNAAQTHFNSMSRYDRRKTARRAEKNSVGAFKKRE